jgi:hypothetical protein
MLHFISPIKKVLLLCSFVLLSIISNGQQTRQDYLVAFLDTSFGREAYGYKTLKGKVVIPAKYYTVATKKFYKFALVVDEKGWVGINRKDSVILKPFINDNFPDEKREGLFRFVESEKMGFANEQGEKIIAARFDLVSTFSNGYASFNVGGNKEPMGEYWYWKGGLWGFINKKGNVVIEPKFTSFSTGDKRYTKAETKVGTMLYINSQGQVVKVLRKKK